MAGNGDGRWQGCVLSPLLHSFSLLETKSGMLAMKSGSRWCQNDAWWPELMVVEEGDLLPMLDWSHCLG